MWTDERTPGSDGTALLAPANTLRHVARLVAHHSRASRSAGRPSIIGRTSSIVSRRLTLVAIW